MIVVGVVAAVGDGPPRVPTVARGVVVGEPAVDGVDDTFFVAAFLTAFVPCAPTDTPGVEDVDAPVEGGVFGLVSTRLEPPEHAAATTASTARPDTVKNRRFPQLRIAAAYAKTPPVQPSRRVVRHASVDIVRSPVEVVSFEHTYAAERDRLVRLAHLLTGSVAVGEEIVQEAFISLRARWDVVDNPAAYARTAVVNLARSNQRRQRLERGHAERLRPASALPPELDETWRIIRRLPADQRAVIVLRFYEDLSLAQIAKELDRPLGTVKSLLHRALKRLKEHMQ